MATIITDGDFTTASAISVPLFSAPFEGDNGRYLLEQSFMQDPNYFAPLNLSIPHPSYPLYYLIEEGPMQPSGGGLVTWKRSYMSIPNPRSDYESFAYRLPGLSSGATNPSFVISSMSTTGGVTTITTGSAHGYSPGDNITIVYQAVIAGALEFPFIQMYRTAISPTSGTTISVSGIVFQTNANYTPKYVVKGSLGRNPITRVVDSRVDWAYYIPGVSIGIASVNDITILNPVVIQDQWLNQVEIYSLATTPTQTAYVASIGTWVVAEASTLKRIKGNLYGRSTRYVVAQ